MSHHIFVFNETSNGGEAFMLGTMTSSENVAVGQKFELHSYGNVATMEIYPMLTPNKLRQLADELEAAQIKFT